MIVLGARLGLGFSDTKRQHFEQLSEYSGFRFDTVRGRLLVLPYEI